MISCICITNKRPQMLDRAVKCFMGQSFSDSELLILYEGMEGENILPETIKRSDDRVRFIPMEGKWTLGGLRNAAVDYSQGEIIAQWDDDDWHHADRLAWQVSAMRGMQKPASILNSVLLFDEITGMAYRSVNRICAPTFMIERDRLPRFPEMERSEGAKLIRDFESQDLFAKLPIAELYIHTFHGENAMPRNTFDSQTVASGKLNPAISQAIAGYLK